MRSVSGDACRARDSAGSNQRLCFLKEFFYMRMTLALSVRNFELLSGRACIATHKYVLVTQIWSGSGSRNDIALVT